MTDRTPDDASERPPARRHRRVQRPGAEGADPTPALPGSADGGDAPDTDNTPSFGTNDERLRQDVPPHW